MIVLARLTVREALRRRLLWVLIGLSLVSVALVGWGVSALVALARESGTEEVTIQLGVSQVLIFIAFMFSFVLAMTAAFLGSPAIAADLESGVALALLARPIRRADLVLGRWLGLSLVIAGYAAASGLLAIAVVGALSGYTPPNPFVAVLYLAAQAIVLLTLTLLLSTRFASVAGGAIAVVAYGLAWMGGVMGGVARALDAAPLASAADLSRFLLPSDGLWRGVVHGLEPAIVVAGVGGSPGAAANPFFAEDAPPEVFLAWSVAWVAGVVALAVVSLRRREL
ncbi:MAG: ABC transporter permease [Chloroflexota bacterium]